MLYGEHYVSHNVHNLLHICDDVKRFDPLYMFDAFPFENYMQVLKKFVRKGDKPIEQIVRRIYEQDNILNHTVQNYVHDDPIPHIEHSSISIRVSSSQILF